jgi:hypothetical protein
MRGRLCTQGVPLRSLGKIRLRTWASALTRTRPNIGLQARTARCCIPTPARIPRIFPFRMTRNGTCHKDSTSTRMKICTTITKMSTGSQCNDDAPSSLTGIRFVWPHGIHGFRGSSLRMVALEACLSKKVAPLMATHSCEYWADGGYYPSFTVLPLLDANRSRPQAYWLLGKMG